MNEPKVGIGVIVIKNGKVLIGKRITKHGKNFWGFPGGHLEFGESLEECANREVMEEVGIKIKNIKLEKFTNDIFEEDKKHYVTIFAIAEYKSGKVKVLEKDKCEKWIWSEWDKLPSPLFLPIKNLKKTNYNPLFRV